MLCCVLTSSLYINQHLCRCCSSTASPALQCIMAGKRGGMAARSGRGRAVQNLTRDAQVGQKRKAPDVLLSARKAAKDNGAVNAACHASARPGLTMTALQSMFRQQVLPASDSSASILKLFSAEDKGRFPQMCIA